MTIAKKILPYLLAVVASFVAAGIFISLMGFDVFKAYQTILFTSFRTPNGFIQTLLKFIPLTLLALAFTIPLNAGKFNIGGEGQMMAGGIGAAAMGIMFADLPAIILLPLVILGGVVAGALWGLVPAWLLYKFNINEILTTVLFNFIALFLIDRSGIRQ
jgi:simple sugar transport system permease protein